MNRSGAVGLPITIADLAVFCFVCFAVGIATMHVLRPDYAPASHMISDYAVGPWGGVMTAAFASASLGCLALAIGMARSRPAAWVGNIVAALFAVAAVGLAVTAIFPTDGPGRPSTRSGDIHDMSFVVNVSSLVLAAILSCVLAWRDARWRAHRGRTLLFALMLVVALVVQFKTLHRGMPYGIANRVFVAVLIGWLVATARALPGATRTP